MPQLFFILILSFVAMNANALNNKQQAFSKVKLFFNLKQPQLVLKGHFVETHSDYGSNCKIHVNFSHIGNEFLTISGEYTPAGNIGEGIYFNQEQSSFINAEFVDNQLTLEQQIIDSFSTSTTTVIMLNKLNKALRFSIHQTSSFLFIPQRVKKTCLVENYLQK